MSRKVFILALPILFSFIFIGFALSQDRGRGYGGFLERLKQELNLTPEQVTKIQKILDSAQKQALEKYGTLKNLFLKHYDEKHPTIKQALSGFVKELLSFDPPPKFNGIPESVGGLIPDRQRKISGQQGSDDESNA
ncbi:hypothetical protein JGI14_105215 [Candidatus Kryptonium thompsonii]|nr:hypothetical protein JGI14_105215 [Candidatus Kryptonium thompsoni]